MSQNSSDKPAPAAPAAPKRSSKWWLGLGLALWVLGGFVAAQLVFVGAVLGLKALGVQFGAINPAVFNTIMAACVYILTLVLVAGVPWWAKKRRTTRQDIGLTRLPRWMDILLAPAGFVVYLLGSAVLMLVVSKLVPGFNGSEVQNTGFENLFQYFEYLLAFLTLVVAAPFIEEVLFRGYLYGKLRKAVPLWAAILITSALFGFVHGHWNVGLDVFVLSVVMCGLREITGSIWAGILLHMIKNGLAFYLLFINPSILTTMGG